MGILSNYFPKDFSSVPKETWGRRVSHLGHRIARPGNGLLALPRPLF
jgi:hypothetical protein